VKEISVNLSEHFQGADVDHCCSVVYRMGPQGIASGFNGSDMSSVLQNMQRLTELGSRDGTQADLLNLAQHIQKVNLYVQSADLS
jgi:hypothetical protein